MKTVIYTAIFGNKDEAPVLTNKPNDTDNNFDLICITDNPELKSEDYEMMVVPAEFSDLTKNARNVKINGFEGIGEYDVAIWHDSSVRMDHEKLDELSAIGSENLISAFHHRRYCAYLEAVECINQKKDSPIRIAMQMFRYFRKGFPANNKLHETTILVLNKEYFTSELRPIWWHEIKTQSRRDQLALAYARWKSNVEIELLEGITGTGSDNRFSTWVGHRYTHYIDSSIFQKLNSFLIRGICKKLIYEMRRRSKRSKYH